MNTTHQLNESPKERLKRLAGLSRPFRREVGGPSHLIVIALLVLILSMVAVGVIGGTLGSQIAGEYVRRIMEWVWSTAP